MQQPSNIMSLSMILLPSIFNAITATTLIPRSTLHSVQASSSRADDGSTVRTLTPFHSGISYATTVVGPYDSPITIEIDFQAETEIQSVAKPPETDPQVLIPHATPTIALGLEMPSNSDILVLNPKYAAWAATKKEDPSYIKAMSVLSTAIPTSFLDTVHNSDYAYNGPGPISEPWFTAMPNDVQAMVWSVAHEARTLITKMPVVSNPRTHVANTTAKAHSRLTPTTRRLMLTTISASDPTAIESAATKEKSEMIIFVGAVMAAFGLMIFL